MKKGQTKAKNKRSILSALAGGKMFDLERTINQNLTNVTDLNTVRGLSQTLVSEDGYAGSALIVFKNNVLGESGIGLSAKIKDENGVLLDNINTIINEEWQEFGEYGNITTDGLHSIESLLEIALQHILVDGEFVAIKRYGESFGEFGFQVEPIPSELLDDTFNYNLLDNGNSVFHGVETTPHGKPVGYWFRKQLSPFSISGERYRVDAADVIHTYEKRFAKQTRGKGHYTAALPALHNNNRLTIDEVTTQRLATLKNVVYKMQAESEFQWSDDEINAVGALARTLRQGEIEILPPGLDIESVDWNNNSADNAELAKRILRQAAASFGISYNSLTKDWEATSFSSSRMAEIQDAPTFARMQRLIIDQLLMPIYKSFVYNLLDSRQLLPFTTLDFHKFTRAKALTWVVRGRPPVDELKAMKTSTENLKWGLTSRTDELAKSGRDFKTVVDQLISEELYIKEMYEKHGLDCPSRYPDMPADPLENELGEDDSEETEQKKPKKAEK